MHYNCKHCSWIIEGQTQILEQILIHEKTHPENNISNKKYEEPDGKKVKCHMCGCDTDHG